MAAKPLEALPSRETGPRLPKPNNAARPGGGNTVIDSSLQGSTIGQRYHPAACPRQRRPSFAAKPAPGQRLGGRRRLGFYVPSLAWHPHPQTEGESDRPSVAILTLCAVIIRRLALSPSGPERSARHAGPDTCESPRGTVPNLTISEELLGLLLRGTLSAAWTRRSAKWPARKPRLRRPSSDITSKRRRLRRISHGNNLQHEPARRS